MNKLIKKYAHEGTGYNPFLIRDGWQVAQLNYMPEQGMDDIQKIDVHFETDEVFVLVAGKAVLIATEKEDDKVSFEMVSMKQGIVYNIPKGLWHNIAMLEDARVIIIEKNNTHLGDYEYYYLNAEQKEEMYEKIKTFKQF